MNRHLRRIALLTTGLLSALPGAASAAWTAAAELGTTDDVGSGITVAVNAAGAAIAGWTKFALASGGGPGAVQYAVRPVDGAFGPAVNPDPLAPEFPGPGGVDIANRTSTGNALASISGGGESTAIWLRVNNGDVQATSTSSGAFPTPTLVSSALTSRMRMDRNVAGDIVLVNHDGLVMSRPQATATWTAGNSFGSGSVREATVSVDAKGVGLIGWIDQNHRVKVRRYSAATGTFTSPTRLVAADAAISADQVSDFDPAIVVGTDATGRGVVAWRRTIGGKEVVRAAFLNANGTVRAPGVRSVSPLNVRAGQFDVAMAANGNAVIAFTRRVSAIAGLARGPVMVSRRSPVALNWTIAVPIVSGSQNAGFGAPSVAMAKTITFVTWLNDVSGSNDAIQVARRVGVGPWVLTTLDPAVDDRGELPPVVHARGSWAIVGWRTGIGLCCAAYKASLWDPNP